MRRKTKPEDKVFSSGPEAIAYIKTLARQHMERPVFDRPRLNQLLAERERHAGDHSEKGWVHAVQLGWLRHYRTKLLQSKKLAGRTKDRQFLQRYQSQLEE